MIDECIEAIAEIKGVKSHFSDEELDIKIQEAIEFANCTKSKTNNPTYERNKIAHKGFLKKPVLITAILIITLLAFSITVIAIVPSYRERFLNLIKMPAGSQIDEDNITFIYAGRTEAYKSVEELCQKENLNILYPSELPEGIHIKNVQKVLVDGMEELTFVFDMTNVFFSVIVNYSEFVPDDSYLVYDIGESCSAYCFEDTIYDAYSAIIVYKNNFYSVTAPNFESLVFILDHMGGL